MKVVANAAWSSLALGLASSTAIDAATYESITFDLYGSSDIHIGAENSTAEATVTATSTWTSHTLAMSEIYTASTVFAWLNFKVATAGETFYIDNVKLKKTTVPAGGTFTRAFGTGTTTGSAGCNKTPPTLAGATMYIDDLKYAPTIYNTRMATVHLPPSYSKTKAYALVFGLHGYGDEAEKAAWTFSFSDTARTEAIFIYPQGVNHAWNNGSPADDFAFIHALKTWARDNYCIDMDRTFVTGFSQGGGMTHNLACSFATSSAPMLCSQAGSMRHRTPPRTNTPMPCTTATSSDLFPWLQRQASSCAPIDGSTSANPVPRPAIPPPILMIHGTDDNSGGVSPDAGRAAARHWAYAADCDDDPVLLAQAFPDRSTDPCARPACAIGADVEYCEVTHLAHSPWGSDSDYPNEHSAHVWNFFHKY